MQVTPSPLKPVLHSHSKLPSRSLHTALALQLCVPAAHSSIPEENYFSTKFILNIKIIMRDVMSTVYEKSNTKRPIIVDPST